jgi:hypothetical protein
MYAQGNNSGTFVTLEMRAEKYVGLYVKYVGFHVKYVGLM